MGRARRKVLRGAWDDRMSWKHAMTVGQKRRKEQALTLTDVLVSILFISLLFGVYWRMRPHLPWRWQTRQEVCVSNLKQIGLGFRIWPKDGDRFPWAESTKAGGTAEYTNSLQIFRHYQAASNELGNTRILVCPADRKRWPASDWSRLQNSNLSYFLGLTADESRPQTILTGDRTVTTNGLIMSGILSLTSTSRVTWAKGLHSGRGTVGLSDGSAQHTDQTGLRRQLASSIKALHEAWPKDTNRPTVFVIP